MSNNKQTTVEWLMAELNQELNYVPITQWNRIRDLVQRAKQMEKEQIIDAHIHGHNATSSTIKKYDAEQYYNEEYEKL